MSTNIKSADVTAILPASIIATDDLIDKAIEASDCIVEMCSKNISADCLELAKKYLAAHFVMLTEGAGGISSETDCSGGVVEYGIKFGSGVLSTSYGQIANSLTGGCLSALDDPEKAAKASEASRTSGVAFMAVGGI